MSFRINSSHPLVQEGSKQNIKTTKPITKVKYTSEYKKKTVKSGLKVQTTMTSQADFY